MDATLSTINGEPTLRFERRLRHSPAKVWRAVSDPAEMAHWFPAAVEAELRPGAPMRFTFPEEALVDGTWEGEVLEVDEPRVFMFRWNQDVLRIELIPDGDGCRLVFTQTIGGGRVGRLGAGPHRRRLGHVPRPAGRPARRRHGTGTHPTGSRRWRTTSRSSALGEGTVESTSDGYELRFARDLVWKPPADVWATLTEDAEVGTEPPVRATNGDVPPGPRRRGRGAARAGVRVAARRRTGGHRPLGDRVGPEAGRAGGADADGAGRLTDVLPAALPRGTCSWSCSSPPPWATCAVGGPTTASPN